MFPPDDFAPRYFPRAYFPGPATHFPPPGGLVPMAAYRDRDAYRAIVGALSATGEFAQVVFATPPDSAAIGADRLPLAVVTPTGWAQADDVNLTSAVRTASYYLTLVARDEDPQARFERLDRLANIAQNAIEGTDLAGGCTPTLTRFKAGKFDPRSPHPELRLCVAGEFSYIVAPVNTHDTTP